MGIESIMLLRFEWVIALIIIILLIMKLTDADKKPSSFIITINILLVLNFIAGFVPINQGSLFSSFFRTSEMIVLQKNILNLGLLLISATSVNWIYSSKNRIELYILLLSSILGMFTMLSSNHVLTLYLGLEMSTIPLAALANFNKDSKVSSEAGIKLILSSAFSTGMMLFGISLLYGAIGNLSFESVINNLHPNSLTLFAFTFIISGFAFKMSVVPFHLWTADVYEGSPVIVTNFLSTLSKGSVIFVFTSVLYTLFGSLREAWLLSISILAILSMVIGNLFAMRQTNIKRFLAFSSITQAGYVLVGISGASDAGTTSVVYFILIYILSNISSFAVVGMIADSTGKESLNSYRGLYKSNPFYALILALSLLSLAGVPPTAGFFGKLFLLTSGMGNKMFILAAVAAVNLILSLYNYLHVIRIMFMDEEEETLPVIEKSPVLVISLLICIAGILAIGFIPPVYQYIHSLSFGM